MGDDSSPKPSSHLGDVTFSDDDILDLAESEAMESESMIENGEVTHHFEAVEKIHYRFGKSVALYASFLGLGLASNVVGPTLITMEAVLNTDTATISRTALGGGIGYALGSLICSTLFDHFNKEIQFTAAMVLQGVTLAIAPFTGSVYAYIVFCSISAIGCGFTDSGGNSYAITLWEGHKIKGPFMQGIHTTWSLGATLGPLIVQPFLVNFPMNDNLTNVTSLPIEDQDITIVRFAYLTIGTLVTLSGVIFLTIAILERSPLMVRGEDQSDGKQKCFSPDVNRFTCVMLFFLFVHFHAIVFVEGCTGGFIAAFAVKYLAWSNKDSAMLVSAFQAALGVGRLVNIPVASILSPKSVMAINLSATLCSYILACFVGYSDIILWVAVVMAGFFQASTFPTSVLWASNYIRISGLAAGIFLIGSASSALTYPNFVGVFLDSGNPMNMMYMILGAAIFQIIFFICMQSFAYWGSRKSVDEETEMDSHKEIGQRQ